MESFFTSAHVSRVELHICNANDLISDKEDIFLNSNITDGDILILGQVQHVQEYISLFDSNIFISITIL